MSNKSITVYAEALKRQQQETQPKATEPSTLKVTQVSTQARDNALDSLLDNSSDNARGNLHTHVGHKSRAHSRIRLSNYPSRDEIQEFTFRLRDEVKVKVQAEVPIHWQEELYEIASEINVKKLELYRFIIGEFLRKVKRKGNT